MEKWNSRKLVVTLVAMALATLVTLFRPEMAAWFSGAIATIAGTFNIGQGIADRGNGTNTTQG